MFLVIPLQPHLCSLAVPHPVLIVLHRCLFLLVADFQPTCKNAAHSDLFLLNLTTIFQMTKLKYVRINETFKEKSSDTKYIINFFYLVIHALF